MNDGAAYILKQNENWFKKITKLSYMQHLRASAKLKKQKNNLIKKYYQKYSLLKETKTKIYLIFDSLL